MYQDRVEDYLQLATPKIYLDASTGVGIGNPSPTKNLTVSGSISASGDLFINNITSSGGILLPNGTTGRVSALDSNGDPQQIFLSLFNSSR